MALILALSLGPDLLDYFTPLSFSPFYLLPFPVPPDPFLPSPNPFSPYSFPSIFLLPSLPFLLSLPYSPIFRPFTPFLLLSLSPPPCPYQCLSVYLCLFLFPSIFLLFFFWPLFSLPIHYVVSLHPLFPMPRSHCPFSVHLLLVLFLIPSLLSPPHFISIHLAPSPSLIRFLYPPSPISLPLPSLLFSLLFFFSSSPELPHPFASLLIFLLFYLLSLSLI